MHVCRSWAAFVLRPLIVFDYRAKNNLTMNGRTSPFAKTIVNNRLFFCGPCCLQMLERSLRTAQHRAHTHRMDEPQLIWTNDDDTTQSATQRICICMYHERAHLLQPLAYSDLDIAHRFVWMGGVVRFVWTACYASVAKIVPVTHAFSVNWFSYSYTNTHTIYVL